MLTERTMLSLWAYPNVFRPSNRRDVPPKEVADVIAIFGDDIIVFSDKDCQYPSATDDRLLAWTRWYRRAIESSANQLLGAHRYLMSADSDLYSDPSCTVPIPIPLPAVENRRIHLVSIARGGASACKQCVGGRGFMMVANTVFNPSDPQLFVLSQPKAQHFVHVLDETALLFLMMHLDTAQDLVDYLNARAEYLTRPYSIYYQGEHDLFMAFVAGSDVYGEPRAFPPAGRLTPKDTYYQEGGGWDAFELSAVYRTWQGDSQRSFYWDQMLEHLIGDLQSGHFLKNGVSFSEFEEVIRALAMTTRIERRLLMTKAREMGLDSRISADFYRRCFVLNDSQTTGYLMLCTNRRAHIPEFEYVEEGQILAFEHAFALKLKIPTLRRVASLVFPSASEAIHTWLPNLIDVSDLNEDEALLGQRMLDGGAFSTMKSTPDFQEFDEVPASPLPQLKTIS